jgi:S-adenosylmethionine:tRNA ribosyltransferase-isomerase
MRTDDYDYPLPRHLIAQTPVEPRDHSRLMVVERATGVIAHHRHFYEIEGLLRPGDLLVLNDTRVVPARLYGRRADTGGQVELLLLQRLSHAVWRCLGRPGRRLRPSARLLFEGEGASSEAEVEATEAEGVRIVRFQDEEALKRLGVVALPPYVHTPLADPERYQTVYARANGSVAAPTAGLHFTPELLHHLERQGVEMAFVTLHVGLDTFRPVREDDPRHHKLHSEFWELSAESADAINRAKAQGRRVIAVGTTTVRLLEQAALGDRGQGTRNKEQGTGGSATLSPGPCPLLPGSGWAELFILPGHRFRVVDAMVTNFHLPRTTLLMLVCAFAGRELVLRAYDEAIAEGYRFYSFGDGMLVL